MCQKSILDAGSVSDLESTIVGLPRFEQTRPFVLDNLGTLQIMFQKKKKQGNVISSCTKSS